MTASWRDPEFRYVSASTHADAQAFRRRQQERKRRALAEATASRKVAALAGDKLDEARAEAEDLERLIGGSA